MSLAYGSFLTFLILLPGLVFFRFYYSGVFSKQFFKTTALETLYMSLVPGMLLHSLGIVLINSTSVSLYSIDLEVIGKLLSNSNDPKIVSHCFLNIQTYLPQILEYNVLLSFSAMLFGWFFKLIVRKIKLDIKLKLFRFQNSWHYILNAELYRMPSTNVTAKIPDGYRLKYVYVDLLTETESQNILYKGVLVDYELSKNGGLDLIYLRNAKRSNYDPSPIAHNFREIEGDFLILKYENIKNLNLKYSFEEKHKYSTKEIFQLIIALFIIFVPHILFVISLLLFSNWVTGFFGFIIAAIWYKLIFTKINTDSNENT